MNVGKKKKGGEVARGCWVHRSGLALDVFGSVSLHTHLRRPAIKPLPVEPQDMAALRRSSGDAVKERVATGGQALLRGLRRFFHASEMKMEQNR